MNPQTSPHRPSSSSPSQSRPSSSSPGSLGFSHEMEAFSSHLKVIVPPTSPTPSSLQLVNHDDEWATFRRAHQLPATLATPRTHFWRASLQQCAVFAMLTAVGWLGYAATLRSVSALQNSWKSTSLVAHPAHNAQ